MTSNQINYARYLEEKRHNEVGEQLTDWRNKADYELGSRNATVAENSLEWTKLIQTRQQSETERHNKAMEGYSYMQASAAQTSAAAAWQNAQTNARIGAAEIALKGAQAQQASAQAEQAKAQTGYINTQNAFYGDTVTAQFVKSPSGLGFYGVSRLAHEVNSAVTGKPSVFNGYKEKSTFNKTGNSSGGGRNFNYARTSSKLMEVSYE